MSRARHGDGQEVSVAELGAGAPTAGPDDAQRGERIVSERSVTVAIRSFEPSLSPAERRVGQVILEDPNAVVQLSIGDVARLADTSEATVVRFAKKLDFPGYPELRLALATQVGRAKAAQDDTIAIDLGPNDDLATLVRYVAAIDQRALVDTVEQLDLKVLRAAVDAIVAARRIEIVGIGASGMVGTDLEQKLRRIGLAAHTSLDGHAAVTATSVLTEDDVVIALSHSGQTLDVIDAVASAREAGATTIAITNFPRSTLAQTAAMTLTTAAGESVFRAAAMASRTSQLVVVDCLYLAVAQRDYEGAISMLQRTTDAVRTRRATPPTS